MELIVPTSLSRAEAARSAARVLLSAGCVKVRTDEPFRLPSGWASPVYMNCRRIISFPAVRRELVSLGVDLLKSRGCLDGVASIVGGEASGIALAAAGVTVKDIFVIFDYGTFPTQLLLAPLGVTVHALATWQDVLAVAREDGAFEPAALSELEDFLRDPPRWSQVHGGIAAVSAR